MIEFSFAWWWIPIVIVFGGPAVMLAIGFFLIVLEIFLDWLGEMCPMQVSVVAVSAVCLGLALYFCWGESCEFIYEAYSATCEDLPSRCRDVCE